MSLFSLISKPCQSKKTFELLQKTIKIIEKCDDCIHIILTDNSLIQLEQLFYRIEGIDSQRGLTVMLGGNSDFSIKELENSICNRSIKYIILCTNKTQIDKISRLLKRIINTKIRGCKNRFFYIWIDEADRFEEPSTIKIFDKWNDMNNVDQVCFITATPESLIIRYDKLKVLSVTEVYNKRKYNRWNDNIINILPNIDNNPKLYIKRAFRIYEPAPKQIWFIVPSTLNEIHTEITDYLNNLGFCTITVNVNGEILRFPNHREFPLLGSGTLSDRLSITYKSYKLREYPVALIGYQRLSRGITIQSEDFLISHAIFAITPSSKANIYQLAGRLNSNFKTSKKYKKPKVFCSKEFDDISLEMEDLSIEIAYFRYIDIKKYNKLLKTF